MFPHLKKQIDALYRKARRAESICALNGESGQTTAASTSSSGTKKLPPANKTKVLRCPNLDCNSRAIRLYGVQPIVDKNGQVEEGFVWQNGECFRCEGEFKLRVPGSAHPVQPLPAGKLTYADALRVKRREEYKLQRVASEYGKKRAVAEPEEQAQIDEYYMGEIGKQAAIVGKAVTQAEELMPTKAKIVQPLVKKVKQKIHEAKEAVLDKVSGPVFIGGTPNTKARLNKPVDPKELKDRLYETTPRSTMPDREVDVLRPTKVEVDGGHKLEWGGYPTLSVGEVMEVAPHSQSEKDSYKSLRENFRKEALQQPKAAKEWLTGSWKILSTLPMRITVTAHGKKYQAKRDLDTQHPYILSYLSLCQEIPEKEWQQTESDENIINAAALIAALRPLIQSWKNARKSGGKPTLKSKM